jgi:hypothetical protein
MKTTLILVAVLIFGLIYGERAADQRVKDARVYAAAYRSCMSSGDDALLCHDYAQAKVDNAH